MSAETPVADSLAGQAVEVVHGTVNRFDELLVDSRNPGSWPRNLHPAGE
jgi:hypothetical protein